MAGSQAKILVVDDTETNIKLLRALLKIAYAILKTGTPYREPGADFYTRRDSAQAREDYLLRQLRKLHPGCVITITPAEAA